MSVNKIFASFPFPRIPFAKGEVVTLFFVLAFPINFWAILVWFKNIDSISKVEGLWGAVGVGSYMLAFALFESLVLLVAILVMSTLIPKQWGKERLLAQISVIYLVISTGLILQQARSLIELPSNGFFWPLLNFINNMATSYIEVLLVFGAAGVGAFMLWIHRSEKVLSIVTKIIGRLVLLSGIYFVFNLLGIIVIIIRNI